MGALMYGLPSVEFQIPDRALAHLKLTILQKLRRGESFALSLETDEEREGFGRQSLWLSNAIPLRFLFVERLRPTLNRAWLNALAVSSNSASGLRLVDEPEDADAAVTLEATH